MKKLWHRFLCLTVGHQWTLVHSEGDWILGTAKNIWLCPKCDALNISKPWKA